LDKCWRTLLEGAQLEARACNNTTARQIFRYLMEVVPWYGPIYLEALRFEERTGHYQKALKIFARLVLFENQWNSVVVFRRGEFRYFSGVWKLSPSTAPYGSVRSDYAKRWKASTLPSCVMARVSCGLSRCIVWAVIKPGCSQIACFSRAFLQLVTSSAKYGCG
jgi:hypothetical protein